MRADARRNADRLKRAAVDLFAKNGLSVPLKEIARAAGVSHGTLYNLFGTREVLIDAVIDEIVADRLSDAADRALALDCAWEGLATYVVAVCELQIENPAIADLIKDPAFLNPSLPSLKRICAQTANVSRQIVERARRAGVTRPEVTENDLVHLFIAGNAIFQADGSTAMDQWRRHVSFTLDGYRAREAGPRGHAATH